jgi:hypothetical protein
MIVQDERGHSDFHALRNALGQEPHRILFYAFDLLHLAEQVEAEAPEAAEEDEADQVAEKVEVTEVAEVAEEVVVAIVEVMNDQMPLTTRSPRRGLRRESPRPATIPR